MTSNILYAQMTSNILSAQMTSNSRHSLPPRLMAHQPTRFATAQESKPSPSPGIRMTPVDTRPARPEANPSLRHSAAIGSDNEAQERTARSRSTGAFLYEPSASPRARRRGYHPRRFPERPANRICPQPSAHPIRDHGADELERHGAQRSDPDPSLQEGVGDGGLEARPGRPICAAQDTAHLPLVRPTRAQGPPGRPPGSRGLLCRAPSPDEPKLDLLPVLRHRVSQRL